MFDMLLYSIFILFFLHDVNKITLFILFSWPYARIIDDDETDWNYDNSPDWKPGYLYSPSNSAPLDDSSPVYMGDYRR
jgi:hypothetical protein